MYDIKQNPLLTVKVTAHQWYWRFELCDFGITYDSYSRTSYSVPTAKGYRGILDTQAPLVLPFGVPVEFIFLREDVVHSWAIPSLGIKIDCFPGQTLSVVQTIKTPGSYKGMCSEFCGPLHGSMPCHLEVVRPEFFLAWITTV